MVFLVKKGSYTTFNTVKKRKTKKGHQKFSAWKWKFCPEKASFRNLGVREKNFRPLPKLGARSPPLLLLYSGCERGFWPSESMHIHVHVSAAAAAAAGDAETAAVTAAAISMPGQRIYRLLVHTIIMFGGRRNHNRHQAEISRIFLSCKHYTFLRINDNVLANNSSRLTRKAARTATSTTSTTGIITVIT